MAHYVPLIGLNVYENDKPFVFGKSSEVPATLDVSVLLDMVLRTCRAV